MKKRTLGLLLSTVILLPGLIAVATKNTVDSKKEDLHAEQRRQFGWTRDAWIAWASAPWDKDDTAYQRIQAQIDQLLQEGKLSRDDLEQYKQSSLKNGSNPEKAFQWAYAAERLAARSDSDIEKGKILEGAELALIVARFPNTYSYARLCFLTQVKGKRYLSDMIAPGEKLLKMNPKDAIVKYQLAILLHISPIPENQKKALTISQELVKELPQNSNAHSMLGWVYLSQWRRSKSKEDARKAADAYRQYLALAPPDAEFRNSAQQIVNDLEKKQAKP